METSSFNFPTDTRVGPGVIAQLNETLLALGIHRPLVVTDAGLLATDAYKKLVGALLPGKPDRDWFLFSEVQPNPTEANTRGAAGLALDKRCDGIVGLGGGSAWMMSAIPSSAMPSHSGWNIGEVYDSMQWVRASSPVAAVSPGGRPVVSSGSRKTHFARSSG